MAYSLADIDTLFFQTVEEHKQGKLAQAEKKYFSLLSLYPNHPGALHYLGVMRHQQEREQEAEEFFKRSIQAGPQHINNYYNLSCVYQSLRRYDDAISTLKHALTLDPQFALAYQNLASCYYSLKKYNLAKINALSAIKYNPTLSVAHTIFSIVTLTDDVEISMRYAKRAIELNPNDAESYLAYGKGLYTLRRSQEADVYFRKAVDLTQTGANIHAAMVMHYLYHSRLSNQELLFEHVQWAERHLAKYYPVDVEPQRATQHKKLRIGYLSGDFSYHSVAYFLLPIMRNHNHEEFEIYCYSSVEEPDERTQLFKNLCPNWREIRNATDDEAVLRIRADEIDILVDLGGLTASARPALCARKPAPILINYLGYPHSTGIRTIDYRLVDEHTDPYCSAEQYNTETLLRLPDCFLCYEPRDRLPPIKAPPSLSLGYVTFGIFNNFLKITDEQIDVWSAILRSLPKARLLIKPSLQAVQPTIDQMTQRFMQNGVNSSAIVFAKQETEHYNHLQQYNRVDIALDTYPYNGTTTTLEALSMGVAVITQIGDRHSSRVGYSLLRNLDLSHLVANTTDDYVQAAVTLAQNRTELAKMRSTLRPLLLSSALCNGPEMARKLEQAYQTAWLRDMDIENYPK